MSDDYLKQQALKFIADCDHASTCLADIDWSADEDALIENVAAACRQGIERVAVTPPPKIASGECRFTRPDESPEDMVKRCAAGTWRSVGVEFDYPDGPDYHDSPDPQLNTVGLPYGEWTWQLNRHHEWALAARLFHATRDNYYAECVAGWLRAWLCQCPMPEEDLNARQGPWRTIEIGIRMGSVWPQVLSACADARAFDDVLFLAWLQSYAEQSAFVYQHRKRNNWLLMEMNGLMHASAQVHMHKNAALWRQQATDVLIEETKKQFHPDGMQRELSTSYHLVCFHNYMRAIKILHQTGNAVDPRLEQCLKDMLKPLRALAAADGALFNFQDSNAKNIQGALSQCPDAWLTDGDRWFLQEEGDPPAQLHHLLENSGYAVLRSGYGDDAIAVAFDGGPFGDGHQHEDKLSFQLRVGDQLLLGEGGMVDYNDTPERRFSLGTLAHNTAVIDGMEQNRRKTYWDNPWPIDGVANLEHDFTGEQPWVRATYDEGYGEDQVRTVSHTRTLRLLDRKTVEIVDVFSANDNQQHQIEILFHIMSDDAGLKDATCQCRKAGTAFTITWQSDEAIETDLHSGGREPDLRGYAEPDQQRPGLREVVPRPCLTLAANMTDKLQIVTTISIA